jgi:Phage integrase family
VRLHDLRRTAASAGASAGLSLETVGQILGHTQAATTKRYAFLFDDAKREAADLMSARLAQALKARPALRVVPSRTLKPALVHPICRSGAFQRTAADRMYREDFPRKPFPAGLN